MFMILFVVFSCLILLSNAALENHQPSAKNISSRFIEYEVEMGISGDFYSIAPKARRNLRTSAQQKKDLAAISSLATRDTHRPIFQRCKDSGEAYSAAYLIHQEHLLEQKTNYNLTWVNCEMASFIMMNGRVDPRKNRTGTILQTVDVLDFSVIHLSAFERLLLRWQHSSAEVKADKNNLQAVHDSAAILRNYYFTLHPEFAYSPPTIHTASANTHTLLTPTSVPPLPIEHDAFARTVVVMPFLGSDMGAGHSKLANRQAYLSACFWSFFVHYPYVVAMVKSVKDRDYILQHSHLPFWDVVLLEGLPKSASLPVATVQTTKERIRNGTWSQFEYVFFTESDQILMMRNVEHIYAYLDFNRRHLMVPHRLMAYPVSVLSHFHKRPIDEAKPAITTNNKDTSSESSDSKSGVQTTESEFSKVQNGVLQTHPSHPRSPYDWMDLQCCLPRQHCTDRKEWVKLSNTTVPVVKIFGLQVPLGNSNFHAELYRACQLRDSTNQHECP